VSTATAGVASARLDAESRAWLDALGGYGPEREEAAQRLYALLLRAARFQLLHRASSVQLRGESLADLASEAASDALVGVLAHLDDFRGASRFTTWASKFAILEASVALRRRTWKARELPLDWDERLAEERAGGAPHDALERSEWLRALRRAIDEVLTERQRDVFVAAALNGAPIDVLADRLGTTRGAVYKTLHDARRKLRAQLDGLL
jgi:RNA polymerase sigma-70 factor (ECF subfamily)